MRKLKCSFDVRCTLLAAILSIVFSYSIFIGAQLDNTGFLQSWNSVDAALFLLLALMLGVAIYAIFSILDARDKTQIQGYCKNTQSKMDMFKNCRVCLVLVAICWAIWFAILLPGIYGYDAGYWYLEYDSSGMMVTSQWSIPVTWFFYSIVLAGFLATGSYVVGFTVYAVLQAALCLLGVFEILRCLREFNFGAIVMFVTTLFFGLLPTISILVFICPRCVV